MNKKILFSFIIPVFNCQEYLKDCVLSLLRQEWTENFEILLVDDGSKDESGRICDMLALKYENIFSFHKTNGGASSARNYGILQSRGRYIVFVDGDDTLDPAFGHSIVKALQETPESLVVYGMSFDYYRAGKLQKTECVSCIDRGAVSKKVIFEEYQAFFSANVLSSACNKVFRGDLMRDQKILFNEKMTLYEDYDFVLRYLSKIDKVSFINLPLYHYRQDLEDPHITNRVGNLYSLKENTSLLMRTILEVWKQEKTGNLQMLSSGANLYIQLLSQHLLNSKERYDNEKALLKTYCLELDFRHLLDCGAILGDEEKQLWQDVCSESFTKIYFRYYVRRQKRFFKRIIRRYMKK